MVVVPVVVLADLGAVGDWVWVDVDVLGADVDGLLVDVLGADVEVWLVDVLGAAAVEVEVDGAVGAGGVDASAATGILTKSAAPMAAPHRILRTLLPLFVSQL